MLLAVQDRGVDAGKITQGKYQAAASDSDLGTQPQEPERLQAQDSEIKGKWHEELQ